MIICINYYNKILSAIYDETLSNTQSYSIGNLNINELYYNEEKEDNEYYIDLVDYHDSYYDALSHTHFSEFQWLIFENSSVPHTKTFVSVWYTTHSLSVRETQRAGTKQICGNPCLFAGIAMIFSVNPWEKPTQEACTRRGV